MMTYGFTHIHMMHMKCALKLFVQGWLSVGRFFQYLMTDPFKINSEESKLKISSMIKTDRIAKKLFNLLDV